MGSSSSQSSPNSFGCFPTAQNCRTLYLANDMKSKLVFEPNRRFAQLIHGPGKPGTEHRECGNYKDHAPEISLMHTNYHRRGPYWANCDISAHPPA